MAERQPPDEDWRDRTVTDDWMFPGITAEEVSKVVASVASGTMTSGVSRGAEPLTLEALEKAMSAIGRSGKATKAKADPTWCQTTMTWLEENYPAYVATGRGTPAPDRLRAALNRMSYGLFEIEERHSGPGRAPAYAEWLDAAVSAWGPIQHNTMRKFLEDGGYRALAEARAVEDLAILDENGEPMTRETVTVAERGAPPPPAEQTLDAAVDGERLADDPRLGAW
jgi:hypothetical protein